MESSTNINKEQSNDNVVYYYFSHSAFGTYQTCQRKYFYKYIVGLSGEQPYVQALDFGTTIHEMIEEALAQPFDDRVEYIDNLVVNKIEEIADDPLRQYEEKLLNIRDKLPHVIPKYDIHDSGIERYIYTDMFDVEELEQEQVQTFLNALGRKGKKIDGCFMGVRIGGYVDGFLEEKETNKNTVIDWKTGKYYTKPEWIEKYLKQIQLYSYILRDMGEQVDAGKLVYVEQLKEHEVDVSQEKCEEVFNNHKQTALDIMNKGEHIYEFNMSQDERECMQCEYAVVCKL